VLDAILGGARTAYEVVAEAYKDTPAAFWPAAVKNVQLHVEHLDYLHKLPPESMILSLWSEETSAFTQLQAGMYA
jgi:hypothetical protein